MVDILDKFVELHIGHLGVGLVGSDIILITYLTIIKIITIQSIKH